MMTVDLDERRTAELPISLSGVRVLYVEDDRGLAALVSQRMKRTGWDIQIVTTGTAGWEKLSHESFDIALVDNHLPGMTGLEIIMRAAALPDAPPLIMLTGVGNERLAVEAMREGASDYVVKDAGGGFIDLLPLIIERALRDRQNRLARQSAELAAQIESQRRELLTRFIRDASHEFRTPLAIIGTSLYLLEHSELGDRQKRYASSIREQADNIEKLVQSMIHLARLDSLVTLERTPYAVNSLVELINGMVRGIISGDAPLPMVVNHTPIDAAVLTDPEELRLAFRHLLDNAVRYGDPDRPFTLTIHEENNRVVFSLIDYGAGIPEDHLPRVFDRFFRGDEGRTTRGFGLGLPIARRVVDLHNGSISLNSVEGQGTTVVITLPLA